jgi:general stress protein YciG
MPNSNDITNRVKGILGDISDMDDFASDAGRGLQNASKRTRQEVARKGGRASKGGRRK